jgi:glyoxylase-like metal-dependent hydrolase (beta-lactamase superfamily II)
MIFKQLFDDATWTYTYLIADPNTKEAVMIDPVNTQIDVYLQLLAAEGLTLKYSLETHVHADHITGGGLLRQKTGTKTAVSGLCGAETANVQIEDGDVFEVLRARVQLTIGWHRRGGMAHVRHQATGREFWFDRNVLTVI